MSDLRKMYENHHAGQRENDFIYGGDSRIEPIKEIISSINIDEKMEILDLGCRDCAMSQKYLESVSNYSFTGVDIDNNAIERARNKGLRVVNQDIETFLTENISKKFDLIVLSEVLEHLVDPIAILKKINLILKENALLIITVPNAFRLKNRIKFLFGINFEEDYTHVQWFNERILQQYLEDANFKAVKFRYINSKWLFASPKLFGNTILVQSSCSNDG